MLFVSGLVCLFGGFMAFCLYQVHTLNILLSLEAIMLSLLVILYSFNSFSGEATYSFLILLTFAACEAALGLSLLVSMLRLWGNDYVNSLGSMKFYCMNFVKEIL
uniref:NADH-ubiquinone oxidoreductase chain 4L n=1 Tax=Elysia chlorotica TaxID=188477 RepID=B2D6J1_ELYCH|nr:NADH dehydrogenase subunit 4L [Elysia chlorotica]ACB70182.1 NADH dehydrogenase subunit 4L [Elysia chlorotica]